MKDVHITHKKMDFLIIFSGYILYWQLHMEVNCVFIINLYFYIIFVDDFYAISFK